MEITNIKIPYPNKFMYHVFKINVLHHTKSEINQRKPADTTYRSNTQKPILEHK